MSDIPNLGRNCKSQPTLLAFGSNSVASPRMSPFEKAPPTSDQIRGRPRSGGIETTEKLLSPGVEYREDTARVSSTPWSRHIAGLDRRPSNASGSMRARDSVLYALISFPFP